MIFSVGTIRVWQTTNLVLSVFGVGLSCGVFGAALVDLAEIFDTNLNTVVYLLSTRSAGSIASCFIAGPLFQNFNIQIVVLINAFAGGVCLAIVPICPSLLLCHICSFIIGFTIGLIEIGGNVWLITIWKNKSPAILQFYHFMFGVGAMLAPFGTEPFLNKKQSLSDPLPDSTVGNFINSTESTGAADDSDAEESEYGSRIFVPFAVFGIFYAATAIGMLLSYLTDRRDIREEKDSASRRRKVSYRVELAIVAAICLYVFLGVAAEQGYASMISVYVIGNLGFSRSSGAFAVAVFWAAFTLSRIVATVMSIRTKPSWMLTGSHVIMMGAAIVLMVFPQSEWIIWSMTALYAFGLSPFFGNICAWALEFILLNHNYMAAIFMSVCFGAMTPPFIVGPFIEHSPIVFMYSNISFSTLMAMTTAGLLVLGHYTKAHAKQLQETLGRYDPIKLDYV